jgi:hypothetical protein
MQNRALGSYSAEFYRILHFSSDVRCNAASRAIEEDLRVAARIVGRALEQEQDLRDREKRAAHEAKIERLFPELRRLLTVFRGPRSADEPAAGFDGPGALSAAGRPRHDNDKADFRCGCF